MGLGQAEKGQREQQQGSGRHRCAHNVGMTRWDGLSPQGTANDSTDSVGVSCRQWGRLRRSTWCQTTPGKHKSLTKNVFTLIKKKKFSKSWNKSGYAYIFTIVKSGFLFASKDLKRQKGVGNALMQETATFFCTEPGSKNLRVCGPWSLCHNHVTLPLQCKSTTDSTQTSKYGCDPTRLYVQK